ncbi:MAG: sigma-70 family RNA polymerase sigma factor, partial [Ginsengibacter sp.]
MTEELIIQGCLNNLASAQEELYDHFSPQMLGLCFRFAKNREDAEDMLQEGFMKVYGQIYQFRSEGSLEGWIRKIMVHTCINSLKKNKKFSDSVDLIYAAKVHINENMIPSLLQAKQVVECIRMLPIGYRTVLNLHAI